LIRLLGGPSSHSSSLNGKIDGNLFTFKKAGDDHVVFSCTIGKGSLAGSGDA
jgi:hypothetical protein